MVRLWCRTCCFLLLFSCVGWAAEPRVSVSSTLAAIRDSANQLKTRFTQLERLDAQNAAQNRTRQTTSSRIANATRSQAGFWYLEHLSTLTTDRTRRNQFSVSTWPEQFHTQAQNLVNLNQRNSATPAQKRDQLLAVHNAYWQSIAIIYLYLDDLMGNTQSQQVRQAAQQLHIEAQRAMQWFHYIKSEDGFANFSANQLPPFEQTFGRFYYYDYQNRIDWRQAGAERLVTDLTRVMPSNRIYQYCLPFVRQTPQQLQTQIASIQQTLQVRALSEATRTELQTRLASSRQILQLLSPPPTTHTPTSPGQQQQTPEQTPMSGGDPQTPPTGPTPGSGTTPPPPPEGNPTPPPPSVRPRGRVG